MRKKRLNGEGGLSWDKQRKKWCGSFIDKAGKRHKYRNADKQAVIAWIIEMQTAFAKADAAINYDATLQEYSFAYVKAKAANPKVAESTINYYIYIISKLYPLAEQPMKVITAEDINTFLETADISDSNRLKVYKMLCMLFNSAVRDRLITFNPMGEVAAPEYEPEYDDPFTPQEIAQIINYLRLQPQFLRYYALCSLETVIGARIGEILGIERITLDFNKNCCKIKQAVKADVNGRMYVGKTKTKASVRTQYFDAGIAKILKAYIKSTNISTKYLFCTRNGTPISVRNMQRAWKMILNHAGVRYRSFHYLRHSFITEMFIQGFSAADIAAVVGHSRLETTNRYALKRQDKIIEIARVASSVYNIA